MDINKPPRTATDPIALSSTEAAELLGISRAHFWKLYQSDRTPRPRRLGKRLLWSRAELEAWFAVGCPSHDRWEQIKGETLR